MLIALLMVLLPIWTFICFFSGIGLGTGDLKLDFLTTQLAKRRAIKAQVKPKTGPNICQCGCMKSFHREGMYECQAPMFDPLTGGVMQQSCRCCGYISSQVPEYVDILDDAKYHNAQAGMAVDNGRKQLEAAKAATAQSKLTDQKRVREGEII